MVRSTILTGRSGIMPSFERSLSDEDIQNIILYLHTLKAPTKAATPGQPSPVPASATKAIMGNSEPSA
jgi:mono/diheme cytochrome c family protein